MKLLIPERIIHGLPDVSPEELKREGIRYLLLDVDNTFMALNGKEIPAVTVEFVKRCREVDLEIVLFSNNFARNIRMHSRALGLPYYSFALKPLPFTYCRFLRENGVHRKEVLAIGDQIFTDVLGAHLVGISCYFLAKEHENDRFLTRLLRHVERRILNHG